MARLLARLIAINDGWARPFGDFNHRWLSALFGPIRPIKDLLNGRWLGHPLHAATTDIPIGALLVAVLLDLARPARGGGPGPRRCTSCSCSCRVLRCSPTTPTPTARPGRAPPSTPR